MNDLHSMWPHCTWGRPSIVHGSQSLPTSTCCLSTTLCMQRCSHLASELKIRSSELQRASGDREAMDSTLSLVQTQVCAVGVGRDRDREAMDLSTIKLPPLCVCSQCPCSQCAPPLGDQLSSTTSGLEEKTRELSELTEYYNSMLQAKETSIESLQQLMENQQRAHKEAQVGFLPPLPPGCGWEALEFDANWQGMIHNSSHSLNMFCKPTADESL